MCIRDRTTIANDHINSAKYEFADPEHDRTQEEVVEKEVDPEAESVECCLLYTSSRCIGGSGSGRIGSGSGCSYERV